MPPATINRRGVDGRCIPYRSTTPGQRTQAVFWVAGELDDQFSGLSLGLSLGKWSLAFQRLRPDLWEENGRVRLDQEELARFADYLANALLGPDPDSSVCPCARYLARHSVNFSLEAARVLVDLKAGPLARNPRLVQLLERLADGNHVANRVLRMMREEPRWGSTDQPAAEKAD